MAHSPVVDRVVWAAVGDVLGARRWMIGLQHQCQPASGTQQGLLLGANGLVPQLSLCSRPLGLERAGSVLFLCGPSSVLCCWRSSAERAVPNASASASVHPCAMLGQPHRPNAPPPDSRGPRPFIFDMLPAISTPCCPFRLYRLQHTARAVDAVDGPDLGPLHVR